MSANVVMDGCIRLRIDAEPRLESNNAEIVVPFVVIVILACAFDVEDVKRYNAEARNWKNI